MTTRTPPPGPTPQQLADAVRNDLELVERRGYSGTIAIHTLDLRAVFDVLDAALPTSPATDLREALARMFYEAAHPHGVWSAGHEDDGSQWAYDNAYSRADQALALVARAVVPPVEPRESGESVRYVNAENVLASLLLVLEALGSRSTHPAVKISIAKRRLRRLGDAIQENAREGNEL